jgi:hypothetical protein
VPPFGVRAVSALDAQRTVVEEGDLEVGRVLDLQGSITPVTSKGRWSGRHQISYVNWGNSPVHLRLTVKDDEEALGFQLEPEQLSVPVGGSAPSGGCRSARATRSCRRGRSVGRSRWSASRRGRCRRPARRARHARAGPRPGPAGVLDGAIQHVPIPPKA